MINPTKQTLIVASLIACAGATWNATAAQATNSLTELPERPDYREWTLGLDAGLGGAGGSVSWRFFDHVGVRAGFDYIKWTEDNLSIADFRYSAKLRLMSEPLTLDLYPWKKHSFRVSVGWLFNQNKITGTSSGFGPATVGGETIEFHDVGVLNLRVEQQLIDPYLSIGGNFLYFDRARHWALGGELGVLYTGDPKVTLSRSGGISSPIIDAALNHEQQRAQDWANQYKWLPVVRLMVSYSS